MHGYIAKSIRNNPKTDHKVSKSWTRNEGMSSKFKAYASAMKAREVAMKNMMANSRKKIHQTLSWIQDTDFVKVLMRTLFT